MKDKRTRCKTVSSDWASLVGMVGEAADQVGAIQGDDRGVAGAVLPAAVAHHEHLQEQHIEHRGCHRLRAAEEVNHRRPCAGHSGEF